MIILLDLRDPFGQRIHAKIGELGKESSSGGCAVDFVERKWKKWWGIFTGTEEKKGDKKLCHPLTCTFLIIKNLFR